MVIDLKKLQLKGKTETDFFFEYDNFGDLCVLPDAEIEKPIKILGTLKIVSSHSAVASGDITFVVKGPCSRCLEETEKVFTVPFEELFDKDDDTAYPVVNDKADLSKMTDDVVVLNMPFSLLCKEDCKGICAGCGKNLNKEKCKC